MIKKRPIKFLAFAISGCLVMLIIIAVPLIIQDQNFLPVQIVLTVFEIILLGFSLNEAQKIGLLYFREPKTKNRCWNCNTPIASNLQLCCSCSSDTEKFVGDKEQ